MRHPGYLSGGIAQAIEWSCEGATIEIRDHEDGTLVDDPAAHRALRSILRESRELGEDA